MPPLFQPDVIIVRHRVKAMYDETFIKKQLREMKSDEAGSTSNKNAFQIMSISVFSPERLRCRPNRIVDVLILQADRFF